MDNIIFRDRYVNFNQISRVTLMEIHNILIEYDIELELNDEFNNDWAGFSVWYYVTNCNSLCKDIDKETLSSFVYIITWFMTGNPVEIYSNFKSSNYYKNDKILVECLDIYDNLLKEYDSEIDICNNLINHIYHFYIDNHYDFLKRSERMNCLLTYKDLELFNKVEGKSSSDKLKTLLNNYYK